MNESSRRSERHDATAMMPAGGGGQQPTVSVVLPIRNEARYIEQCLRAVLGQDYPGDLVEVIVVDGASDDDTLQVVDRLAAEHPNRVRVLHNPDHITPVSLNLGIGAATGAIVVRVDGHCEIAPDYVRRCVEAFRETGYECVGGVCITEGETDVARAIAAAQSSPFGVGNVAFRVQRPTPALVDTVPFGAWPRSVFSEVGLFDEELVRNQDDEFAFRLTQAGGRVWYDPAIRSRYFSRATLAGLWRQYFEYGLYKVRVGQKRGGFAAPRHLVPAAFVGALVASAGLALVTRRARWLGIVAGPYIAANAVATVRVSRQARVRAPVVSAAFAILHTSYGAGFLVGLHRWRQMPTPSNLRISALGDSNGPR
jgi:succinoglycan biosynthesis protein ExoA